MRWNVSYDKEQRERAKKQGDGLVTLDIIQPDGFRMCIQLIGTPRLLRYAKSVYKRMVAKDALRAKGEGDGDG